MGNRLEGRSRLVRSSYKGGVSRSRLLFHQLARSYKPTGPPISTTSASSSILARESTTKRAARTAAATAARRARHEAARRADAFREPLLAPCAPARPRLVSPSNNSGLASAKRASSVGVEGSFKGPFDPHAPLPTLPTTSTTTSTTTGAAAAGRSPSKVPLIRGTRRVIPCGTCVAALLTSSSADLCYDVENAGRRAKRCFRCSHGHSCRALPSALEPIGLELVKELVRSNGVTTPVSLTL
ncbi:uncharacterized protein M421DRAFT_247011 [Didymella exigua CBS 183.55]|uniref:Uncharacterized protein n=1 Tax=Didymella exigua CBS 183.55 TaxID=1150837 RepID=A0A6A5RYV7_9PLEO|nr:uncharacterized protein M421DRAFT_247011 [Didymella exigua CBS 183.55]KAF1932699.1 hypothetical protein M421DRAFT_247011 [Didymella exigua CBS 183.55]